MTTHADPLAEYKDGYRDGLGASISVARTCAADPTATPASILELLETLAESSVIQAVPETPKCACPIPSTSRKAWHHVVKCPLYSAYT